MKDAAAFMLSSEQTDAQHQFYQAMLVGDFEKGQRLINSSREELQDGVFPRVLQLLTGKSLVAWIQLFPAAVRVIRLPGENGRVMLRFPLEDLNLLFGRELDAVPNDRSILAALCTVTLRMLERALPRFCRDQQAIPLLRRKFQLGVVRWTESRAADGMSYTDMWTLLKKFRNDPRTPAQEIIDFLKELPTARQFDGFFEYYHESSDPVKLGPEGFDWAAFDSSRWGEKV